MKKFLIIGNMNAITNKEIFPLIKNNQLWIGVSFNKSKWFKVPDEYNKMDNASGYKEENGEKYILVNGIAWFTNMEHNKRNEPLILTKKYDPEKYPKYDNYDAIEVSKVCEIPMDYDGVMGVPITFLDKYCPQQFEIVGNTCLYDKNSIRTKVYTSEECIEAYFNMFGKEGCYPMNSGPMLRKNGFLIQSYKRILIKRILIKKNNRINKNEECLKK